MKSLSAASFGKSLYLCLFILIQYVTSVPDLWVSCSKEIHAGQRECETKLERITNVTFHK